jgi:Fe-S-cluster-containing hydrogenase component 2
LEKELVMNRGQTTFLFSCLAVGLFFLYLSCNNSNPSTTIKPPSIGSWIDVKTGLTDSIMLPDSVGEDFDQFIQRIESGGFEVTWNRIDGAGYYEVRVSKKRINSSNWNNAVLAAKVPDNGQAEITALINKLQPKIKGNSCTGCEYCVAACPNNAITMFRNKAVIDLSLCTGCGKCYDTCNYDAVSDIFFGELYYFAIRAFSNEDTPAEDITCTNFSYLIRYTNVDSIKGKYGNKPWCGFCKAGCFILDASAGLGFENGGCPVNAIYFDERGMIYIDQSKCIYCGKCVEECGRNFGNWSVRREVVSSEQILTKK